MLKTLEHIKTHAPNKDWLIAIIWMMDPAHEMFRKDYVPPKAELKQRQTMLISNESGFFSGLPPSKKKRTLRLPLEKG